MRGRLLREEELIRIDAHSRGKSEPSGGGHGQAARMTPAGVRPWPPVTEREERERAHGKSCSAVALLAPTPDSVVALACPCDALDAPLPL
jgi:hypothetical protein